MRNLTPAVKNIIIINALVLVMCFLNESLMYRLFALNPYGVIYRPWQLVTYMFMHGGMGHLFFNMYSLFIFGTVLERVWGTKKFLFYYLFTGVGAALVHILVQWLTGDWAYTVGASGAIYGVLIGYAMLYPESTLTLLFPPISLKAKWFVMIFAVIELALGVFDTGAGIAHFAHLGGLIFGFILLIIWKKRHKLYSSHD